MATKKAQKPETPEPITVEIEGETYTLSCSRHARKVIDQSIGGIQPAIDAVRNVNCDHLAALVIAGSGIKLNGRKADQLADAIWRDMNDVIGPLGDFVVRMSNGGRDPEPEQDDDGEEKTENPPQPATENAASG